jgi:hypothetical protein
MLKIAELDPASNGTMFDYRLENGDLLHKSEWNGEDYTVRTGSIPNRTETVYTPVYNTEPNENDGWDIIGFEVS